MKNILKLLNKTIIGKTKLFQIIVRRYLNEITIN